MLMNNVIFVLMPKFILFYLEISILMKYKNRNWGK